MSRWCGFVIRWSVVCAVLLQTASRGWTQQQSVNPGINDAFRDPDVSEFVGRFEVESREVYALRQEIVAACRLRPGQTVADIGAGTGLFTRLFSEAVGEQGQVIAVDIAQKFLDHILLTSREAGRRNIETLLCTADSTRLPAESIDVAFICDTYHHFEFPIRTMKSLYQALKPGGRVILIDFHRLQGESSEWVLSHVRAGQEVFEEEITRTGFRKVQEHRELLKENYFVIFEKPETVFPIIAGYGGVLPRPNATDQPRAGARVLFDITGDSQPGKLNPGLERTARLLNLYGAAGLHPRDVQITVVLHGDATRAVLSDAACQERFGVEQNPNLPLINALREAGVDVKVCGQALNNKGFIDAEVADNVQIAVSALTVLINRSADGFATIHVP